jgi:hypothetical protein
MPVTPIIRKLRAEIDRANAKKSSGFRTSAGQNVLGNASVPAVQTQEIERDTFNFASFGKSAREIPIGP